MIHPNFALLAAVINLASAAAYAYQTLKGRNQPNRVTWGLWALAPMIGFAAQLSVGGGLESIFTLSIGLGPLLVFLASFLNRQAYWRLTRFDLLCGVISLAALVLWAITQQGLVALALSVIADGFAAIPTVKKAYQEPASESGLPYLGGAVAALLTLLAIPGWTSSNAVFGLYILLMDGLLAALVLLPHLRLSRMPNSQA